MPEHFHPAVIAPDIESPESLVFAFQNGQLITVGDPESPQIPRLSEITDLKLSVRSQHFLGHADTTPCYALDIGNDHEFEPDVALSELRRIAFALGEFYFMLAGRALQVITWNNDHQFCGRCGGETRDHESCRAKVCTHCGHCCYPRLSPCMIVLVTRGDEVLLGRAPNWREGQYSTLAGFIEPGETVEQSVHREVMEEVGVTVDNLEYISSQPWPFPHSLMIGFHAEYQGGDITVDGIEIEDAQWFSIDDLPLVPPLGSISRMLIETYRLRRAAL